nr:type II secretion system F family protein [Sporohalobacter salinus]
MLAVFLITIITVVVVYNLLTARRTKIKERLDKYSAIERGMMGQAVTFNVQEETVEKESLKERLLTNFNHFLTSFLLTASLEDELQKTNLPLKVSEFIIIALISCFSLGLVGILISNNLIVIILLFLLGLISPYLYLKYSQKKRLDKFNEQIIDSLTIISNSLKAGYSFFQAIEMVAKEMSAPISEEFTRVLKEMNLGASPQEALTSLTERIESEDLDLVITAVLIQRQVGGNLSEILDSISDTIRERIKIKGEIQTLTAQGKMSGIIIALLPISLGGLLFLINPEYMSPFFKHPLGRAMIIIGIISQILGAALIKKIINIEV